jgi:hypothetical protein
MAEAKTHTVIAPIKKKQKKKKVLSLYPHAKLENVPPPPPPPLIN